MAFNLDAMTGDAAPMAMAHRGVRGPPRAQPKNGIPQVQTLQPIAIGQPIQPEGQLPPPSGKKPVGGQPLYGVNLQQLNQVKLNQVRPVVKQQPQQQQTNTAIPIYGLKPSQIKQQHGHEPKKEVRMISSDDIDLEVLETLGVMIIDYGVDTTAGFNEFDMFVKTLN